MPLLCVKTCWEDDLTPVHFRTAFSKFCLRYYFPSISRFLCLLLIFFVVVWLVLPKALNCSEERVGPTRREGGTLAGRLQYGFWPCCWLAAWPPACLPARVLCLHQENNGLGKIHTDPGPKERKDHPVYLLLWGSVNGSTLGLFMPLSDPHKNLWLVWGWEVVWGVPQRPCLSSQANEAGLEVLLYVGIPPSLPSSLLFSSFFFFFLSGETCLPSYLPFFSALAMVQWVTQPTQVC